MLKYALKRVATGLISIFIVITLTFFLMNMVPGGPFDVGDSKAVSEEAKAAINEKYGLDKPIFQRYTNYMEGLLKGDLGISIKQRGRTVSDIMFKAPEDRLGNAISPSKFEISARLALLAVMVSLLVGIPLGCLSAYHRGKISDSIIIVFSTFGIAIPTFVSSILLLNYLGTNLGWLPTTGIQTARHYIMPVIALAIYPTAYIIRLMRSSLLDVMGQDYIRTAKAKGLSNTKILFKHALRNAILPVVTYVGPMLAFMMTGSFVVEKVFVIPGLGKDFVSSITNRDYPMIMGTTIVLATLVITANVIVDILYKVIDPRIKLK